MGLPSRLSSPGDVINAPENTVPAFTISAGTGADGIELDVRFTREVKLVEFHDRCLDPTSDGKGPVNHWTQDQDRSFDAGSWFSPEFQGERPPT